MGGLKRIKKVFYRNGRFYSRLKLNPLFFEFLNQFPGFRRKMLRRFCRNANYQIAAAGIRQRPPLAADLQKLAGINPRRNFHFQLAVQRFNRPLRTQNGLRERDFQIHEEVNSLPPENFMREHVDFDVKVAGDAARRRLPAPGEFYHLAVMDARGNGNLNLLASLRHSRPAALRAGTLRNLPAPVAAPAFPKAREGTEKKLARLAQDALPPARRTFFKSASRLRPPPRRGGNRKKILTATPAARCQKPLPQTKAPRLWKYPARALLSALFPENRKNPQKCFPNPNLKNWRNRKNLRHRRPCLGRKSRRTLFRSGRTPCAFCHPKAPDKLRSAP